MAIKIKFRQPDPPAQSIAPTPAEQCSSLCHPEEPCSITETGECDVKVEGKQAGQCEHVWNPQTNACIKCLQPSEKHEFTKTEPAGPLVEAMQKAGEAPPWQAPEGYTILDALKDHFSQSQQGRTLLLVGKASPFRTWVVKGYSPDTGRALLEDSQDKMVLRPVISQREVPLYTPFWR